MASESESREGHTRPHELINSMNNGTASDGVLSPGEDGGESAGHPDRRLIGRLATTNAMTSEVGMEM